MNSQESTGIAQAREKKDIWILGISGYYHDSAACLIKNGNIVAAAQEERFSRKKHDASYPYHAIEYVLKEYYKFITLPFTV